MFRRKPQTNEKGGEADHRAKPLADNLVVHSNTDRCAQDANIMSNGLRCESPPPLFQESPDATVTPHYPPKDSSKSTIGPSQKKRLSSFWSVLTKEGTRTRSSTIQSTPSGKDSSSGYAICQKILSHERPQEKETSRDLSWFCISPSILRRDSHTRALKQPSSRLHKSPPRSSRGIDPNVTLTPSTTIPNHSSAGGQKVQIHEAKMTPSPWRNDVYKNDIPDLTEDISIRDSLKFLDGTYATVYKIPYHGVMVKQSL